MKTVADVIEELTQFDPLLPVVVSKDAEGNGFSNFDEATAEVYDFEDCEMVSDDGDGESPPKNVVVLWRV